MAGRLCRPHVRNIFKLPEAFDISNKKKFYSERRRLGYPIDKMYAIAADVQRYSEFVPWCIGSTVVRQLGDNRSHVQLSVGFPPIVESYTSEVTFIKPKLVKVSLSLPMVAINSLSMFQSVCMDSHLFKQLVSQWQFYTDTTHPPETCTLVFSVVFEFRSAFYSSVANMLFEQITRQMINAFLERAKTLHGQPISIKSAQ